MKLIIFGPPGAGKGTQAAILKTEKSLYHLSTGDIFRAAMKAGTPVGDKARSYVKQGQLVPDEVVWGIALDALERIGYDAFILDGYPRTVQQAQWLDEQLLKETGQRPVVISLIVDDEILVRRLSRRRINKISGQSYHLDFNPPPEDIRKENIIQRADDRPEAIRHRLQVYHNQTAPVEAHYEALGILHRVDGVGTIEEVSRRIDTAIETAQVESI